MAGLPSEKKIVIIGAGMSGPVMAMFLAQRGFAVDIYEQRADMRGQGMSGLRSINLTLAERGIGVLREVGLSDADLERLTVPLEGRIIHTARQKLKFQPYGENKREVIHSILRNELNIRLLDLAEKDPLINIHFRRRCVGLDRKTGFVTLREEETGYEFRLQPEILIGADGTFSTVRQQMHRGIRADYSQMFLEAGYKELKIPAGADGSYVLNPNALHVWPRGNCLLLVMANTDRTFTCSCVLPFEGEKSFEHLKKEPDVLRFFHQNFSDAVPLVPNLARDFLSAVTADFLTTITSPWYYEDRIVLMGDACHTVTPFYGQGMNAAFEDCQVLDRCIEKYGRDWKRVFSEYQQLRKRHTDALAALSVKNYYELADTVRQPGVRVHKKIDFAMHWLLGNRWIPIYTMISHSTMPYADAVERARKQDLVLKFLGLDAVVGLVTLITRLWLYVTALARRAPARPRPAPASESSPEVPVIVEPRTAAVATAAQFEISMSGPPPSMHTSTSAASSLSSNDG